MPDFWTSSRANFGKAGRVRLGFARLSDLQPEAERLSQFVFEVTSVGFIGEDHLQLVAFLVGLFDELKGPLTFILIRRMHLDRTGPSLRVDDDVLFAALDFLVSVRGCLADRLRLTPLWISLKKPTALAR